MTFLLTPGQRHEAAVFVPLMRQGAVKRHGPGHPKLRPTRLVGDKGCSSWAIRQYLRPHGLRVTIPRKQCESRTGASDQSAEAVPARGHTIREVSCQLSGDAAHRSDHTPVVVCKRALEVISKP